MITLRPSKHRGITKTPWLTSYHSFSFGGYRDPNHMGFGPLRVINEDLVTPGQGFHTHGHKDMEIITYVLEGALGHKDSLGNGTIIKKGDVQKMSAGTGIEHSEFNASSTEPVHFVQIWITPNKRDVPPSYGQIAAPNHSHKNELQKIASGHANENIIPIYQDAELYAASLEAKKKIHMPMNKSRQYWLQNLRGAITLNGESMQAGDGAAIADEAMISIAAQDDAEFLLFDLPLR